MWRYIIILSSMFFCTGSYAENQTSPTPPQSEATQVTIPGYVMPKPQESSSEVTNTPSTPSSGVTNMPSTPSSGVTNMPATPLSDITNTPSSSSASTSTGGPPVK